MPPAKGFRILRRRKDAEHRNGPIDTIRRDIPRLKDAFLNALAGWVAMRGSGPYDRLAVSPGDESKSLANRRGTPIAGADLPPFHTVASFPQNADELAEPAPRRFLALSVVVGRPNKSGPTRELFNVFERDDPRLDGVGPPTDNPSKGPALSIFLPPRGFTFGFREPRAIRGCVKPTHLASIGRKTGIDFEDVGLVMLCLRVVFLVKGYGRGVVVDRD